MTNRANIFRDALGALIVEMKDDGRGERRIPLHGGIRRESSNLGSIYAFAWSDPADLIFEGAIVRFQSGRVAMDATIVLISADSIFILLARDFGERIDTATIVVDQTGFLEALRRRMDDISSGKAVHFNASIAERTFTNQQSKLLDPSPKGATTLNEAQRRFIGSALSAPLAWLWGPPGTGKTWTLTALVEELYSHNERTLILSNTNKAVDQVLLALCQRLGHQHDGIRNGAVVRVGRIAHPELEREWASDVLPEKIAERLSAGPRDKLAILRTEQVRCKEEHEKLSAQTSTPATPDKSTLNRLKFLESRLATLGSEIAPLQREIDEIAAQVVAKAKIVGATITKTFLSPTMFSEFDTIVIDEASMVLLPACYHAAGLARTRVVISGDFRQLPPILPTNTTEIIKALGGDVFERAGITQSIDSGSVVPNLIMLTDQWRYPPAICDLVSRPMYGGRLRTSLQREHTAAISKYPFDKPVSIIDTSDIGALAVRHLGRGSRINLGHALVLRNLLRHLIEQGAVTEPRHVGVISPYAAQAELLKNTFRDLNIEIDCGTVHRFQGDERDIIVLDLTEAPGEADYLGRPLRGDRASESGPRLINVALTRARTHLIILAHVGHFIRHADTNTMVRRHLDFILTRYKVVLAPDILSLYPIDMPTKEAAAPPDGIFHEKNFFDAMEADIDRAKHSVEIYSAFMTLQRVAKLEPVFRRAIARGVKLRCITRPPKGSGMPAKAQADKALTTLDAWGVIVDLRHAIHQKVVLVDDAIAYFGSLNPLSATVATRETMLRFDNPHSVEQLREALAIPGLRKEGDTTAYTGENKPCPDCSARTVFHAAGYSLAKAKSYDAFWRCDSCDWKMNHRIFQRNTAQQTKPHAAKGKADSGLSL